MVTLDPLVPERDILRLGRRLQPHGSELGPSLPSRRLGRGKPVELQRPLRSSARASLGRQLLDTATFRFPEHAQGEPQPGVPVGRVPSSVRLSLGKNRTVS